jgi:hypothetical protein
LVDQLRCCVELIQVRDVCIGHGRRWGSDGWW